MKRIITISLILFLNSINTYISAYKVEYKGLYYDIDVSSMSAKLIKGDNEYSGKIIIPNEIVYNGRSLPVTEIGENTLKNSNLTSLTISSSVKIINTQGPFHTDEIIFKDSEDAILFYNYGRLIEDSINYVYIGREIKYKTKVKSASGLGNVMFCDDGSLKQLDRYTKGRKKVEIGKVVFGSKVKCIKIELFMNCNIKEIDFGNNVTFSSNIGNNIRFSCPVRLPESVKELPKWGLGVYIHMPSLILPNSLEVIPESAFEYCGANEITLGNKVKEIGDYAFLRTNITKIEIPSTIETIGYEAFGECKGLKHVIIKRNDPSTVKIIERNIRGEDGTPFSENTYINGCLYVPKGSINKYANHSGFGKFFNIREYDGTLGIEDLENEKGRFFVENSFLFLKKFRPNLPIKLYNEKGILIFTGATSSEGNLSINLSLYKKGIYLLNADKQTFKIVY